MGRRGDVIAAEGNVLTVRFADAPDEPALMLSAGDLFIWTPEGDHHRISFQADGSSTIDAFMPQWDD